MRYISCALLLTIFLCTTVSSCKKGCTNPSALNYNNAAKEDDASCLFCDSVAVDIYDSYSLFRDENNTSIYHNENVLKVLVKGELLTYTGNNCKQLGFVSPCTTQNGVNNFAYIGLEFENQVGDTLVVNGNLSLGISGSFNDDRYERDIVYMEIAPYSKLTVANDIYYPCVQSNGANFFLSSSYFSFNYK